MTDCSEFLSKIINLTANISSFALEQFCNNLEKLGNKYNSTDLVGITQSIGQPEVREVLARLINYQQTKAPELTPQNLAWAIRAANVSDEFHRKHQTIELVWTGPAHGHSNLRRTDQVLLDLIQSAKHSLIIVTFAAYKIPRIAEALVIAAERGISIILILESVEQSEGKVTFNALKALGDKIASKAKVYIWPIDKRTHDAKGNHGSLHVKCAIADGKALLSSSANLTEFAFHMNMEMGLFIRGGKLPQQADTHFRGLINGGIFRRINKDGQ